MALDERFIPITLLNSYFNDKDTGLPLVNGSLEFYRDTSRSTPKTVYQLSNSGGDYQYTALPNPVPLNSVGTVQNAGGDNIAIYAFPFINDPITSRLNLDLYYLVCKNSAGVVQWTREAIPNLTDASSPVNSPSNYDVNQLGNPQFTRYFLTTNSPSTLVLSGSVLEFPIAPDWALVAGGTGTIDIERIPVAGNETIPTFPAYYLRITVGLGVANPFLRQRLNKNSGLWSGTFASGFIVAKVESGSNSLTMKYRDSAGINDDVTIFSAGLSTSWESYGGAVALEDSSNTQSDTDAFVDITVELPIGNVTDITSLQVVSSEAEIADIVPYSKRTANREQALMGDYYIPRLEFKPIPSLLIGWDFPLNPRQFAKSGSRVGDSLGYIWDQTMLQPVAGLTVSYDRSVKTGGLQLTHEQADLPFALVQYISGEEASRIVGTSLSVNINGYTTDGANTAQNTGVQVRLFANKDLSTAPVLTLSLVTLDSEGEASLTGSAVSAGWYEIPRGTLPIAGGELVPLNSSEISRTDKNDLTFNNWAITDATQVDDGVQTAAIVVSFLPAPSISQYATELESISLTEGDIPTRPAPLSFSQTLTGCQHFYQKSCRNSTLPANNIGFDQATWGVQSEVFPQTPTEQFGPLVRFKEEMRGVPAIVLHNPERNNFQIQTVSFPALLSNEWTGSFVIEASTKGFVTRGTAPHSSTNVLACAVVWSADARIGVV